MLGKFIDYVVGLPGMLLFSAALGTQWMYSSVATPPLITGVALVAWLLIMSYETGYKKYYRPGRRLFFYLVFVCPTTLGIGAYTAGMIWKFA